MFHLFRRRRVKGDEVDLIHYRTYYPIFKNDVKTYYYEIVLKKTREVVGLIDLRVGMNEELYYYGNMGYSIFIPFRGHHYALKAGKLLLSIAKEFEMEKIIITCNPDNVASYKTIEGLGAKLKGIEEVPIGHPLRLQGDPKKCIFEIIL